MENEVIFKKCNKCGALVEVINDCHCGNCGINCCGEQMQVIRENSVDAAVEKHVPNYKAVGAYVYVNVAHVMEDEHFIEWVALTSEKLSAKKFFKPGEEAVAVFPYIKGGKLLAYCNKHGLWSKVVE